MSAPFWRLYNGIISLWTRSGLPSLTPRLKWMQRFGMTSMSTPASKSTGFTPPSVFSISRPATDSGRSIQEAEIAPPYISVSSIAYFPPQAAAPFPFSL